MAESAAVLSMAEFNAEREKRNAAFEESDRILKEWAQQNKNSDTVKMEDWFKTMYDCASEYSDKLAEVFASSVDVELKEGKSIARYYVVATAGKAGFFIASDKEYQRTCRPYDISDLLLPDNVFVPDWVICKYKMSKSGIQMFDGYTIRVPEMARAVRNAYNMHYVNDTFWNAEGELTETQVRNLIYKSVIPFFDSGISRWVNEVYSALQCESFSKVVKPEKDLIYCQDATILKVSADEITTKTDSKAFTMNRLNVKYVPGSTCPRWLEFINELLEKDEIPVLQEFLGYMLTPSTDSGKYAIMVGGGGEGKSQVIKLMNEIFANSAYNGKLQSFCDDRFTAARFQYKLAWFDDDLNTAGLRETGTFKSAVTGAVLEAERKGKDKYQFIGYGKFFCCGNQFPVALYDKTDGFYRRMLLFVCKQKPKNRVDDPYLIDKLIEEKNGIFCWMLEGLQRLLKNKHSFSYSETMSKALAEKKSYENPVRQFIEESGCIAFDPDDETGITTKILCEVFRNWCEDNAIDPPKERSVTSDFGAALPSYGARKDNHVLTAVYKNGRKVETRVNGYKGIVLTSNARYSIT